MAGPGDKYAKDTRKYNPEFAAANPEEDYDSKLDEVLHCTVRYCTVRSVLMPVCCVASGYEDGCLHGQGEM